MLQLGITTCFKIDSELRHCKNVTEEELMWVLLYADDISLVYNTAETLREAGTVVAAQPADPVIILRGTQRQVVAQFDYLGSVFTSDCT